MAYLVSLALVLFVWLSVSDKLACGSPLKRSPLESLLTGQAEKTSKCDVDGEVESADACKPFCVCHKGNLICAEITCTDDYESPDAKAFCGKVHVAGRCCHNYLCVSEDGTGTMVYPLPIVSAPDELYESR